MSERVPCLVPHCGRTIKTRGRADGYEWICPKHWRLVSRVLRRRYGRAKRRALRPDATLREWGRAAVIWDHCRSQAIGRAWSTT